MCVSEVQVAVTLQYVTPLEDVQHSLCTSRYKPHHQAP